ncbi:alpha-N-arabinofuranosidase [Parahaliea aestuarii]|uniref:non-reducing end alpha-L-arabinofuranosidase n=1 Tax=Parahaliea aestuarii TaxID=1852021 RepID=A0A5C9A4V2_9GAMM|nr:alpha-L-arabinofuranosidase C-terminal domain-containing protein [Parahaliea aestuarii]TXS94667.1 alpha-N-arabinofuranosidase [Parahaliea aestuarii]
MKQIIILTLLLCVTCLPVSSRADTVRLAIDSGTDGPLISRNIYGQFAEHLGRGIYGGIYVGSESSIPNTDGFRNDVIQALRELQVPLVRWPGGCFADQYHWRDGIGPRDSRPLRVNHSWGGVKEDNRFGTHEFFRFIELIGAEAYISANLGSGTIREMAEWLEYMTAATDSAVARERRGNGREEPWQVAFFGVGNESWGCGGNMQPEFYAHLYNQYATFLNAPEDKRPKFVASGGHSNLLNWTEVLSGNIKQNMDGISYHYYTLPTGDWDTKGSATGFGEAEWISTLVETAKMDSFLAEHIAALDRNDPDGKVGFYVDEWGTWYDEEDPDKGALHQRNTLRDAMVAAINLNYFHKYARRVHMANIAQMVNVLQAMILTDGERMVFTPTYHVFHMYRVFQDAVALPFSTSEIPEYRFADRSTAALSFSVARAKDGKIYLAVTNADPRQSHQIELTLGDRQVTSVTGKHLTAPALDAENGFGEPGAVKPSPVTLNANSAGVIEIPSRSILVVELKQ